MYRLLPFAGIAILLVSCGRPASRPADQAYQLGKKSLSRGDYDQAIFHFDEALRHDPGYSKAYLGRGQAYAGKDNRFRALEDFNKAVQLDPQNAAAYRARAGVQPREQCLADLTESIRLDPQCAGSYQDRAGVYQKNGRFRDAIKDYDAALLLTPEDGWLWMARGMCHWEAGNRAQAIADVRKAVYYGAPAQLLLETYEKS